MAFAGCLFLMAGVVCDEGATVPDEYKRHVHYIVHRIIYSLQSYPYNSYFTYDSDTINDAIRQAFAVEEGDTEDQWTLLKKRIAKIWKSLPEPSPERAVEERHQANFDRSLFAAAFELLDPSLTAEVNKKLIDSLSGQDRDQLIRIWKEIDQDPTASFEIKEHSAFSCWLKSRPPREIEGNGQPILKAGNILAHQGGHGHYPENSLPAFQHAITTFAEGIECDLRLSKDDVVFVLHDKVLERLTGKAAALGALTSEEVLDLKLRDPFHPDRKGTESPLPLDELLKACGGKALLWLELKPDERPALARKVGDLLLKYDLVDEVIVSSLSPAMLQGLRDRFPTLKVAYEFLGASRFDPSGFINAPDKGRLIISVNHFAAFAPDLLRKIQKAGLQTSCFTVNRFDALRKALEQGITYIQTDRPDRALYLRRMIDSSKSE